MERFQAVKLFLTRVLPLGDRRKLLGLAFILAVALIWVVASFFVQGLEEHGAHPAVLTMVANSLFAVYVPVYYLNLRIRRSWGQAQEQREPAQEAAVLVPANAARSDEGDTPPSLAVEDSGSKGPAPTMALKQLFRASLIVRLPPWAGCQLGRCLRAVCVHLQLPAPTRCFPCLCPAG